MEWWRARTGIQQVLILLAVLTVVAIVAIDALAPPSQSERDREAKSKACTAAANEISLKNVRDGYEPLTRSEVQRGYDFCMENPALDARGNLTTTTKAPAAGR